MCILYHLTNSFIVSKAGVLFFLQHYAGQSEAAVGCSLSCIHPFYFSDLGYIFGLYDGVKTQVIAACLCSLRAETLSTNRLLHMADEPQTKSLRPYAALGSQVVTLVTSGWTLCLQSSCMNATQNTH